MSKQYFFPNGSILVAVNPTSEVQLMKMAEPFLNPDPSACNVRNVAQVPVLENIKLVIRVDGSQSPMVGADVDETTRVVGLWASRSRCPGIRGNRFAVVNLVSALPDGNDVELTFDALVSTVVWYNDRHVTVGYPNSLTTWDDDTDNLTIHLPNAAKITVINSATHGDICNGVMTPRDLTNEESGDLTSAAMDVIKVLAAGPDGINGLDAWLGAAREALEELESQAAEIQAERD